MERTVPPPLRAMVRTSREGVRLRIAPYPRHLLGWLGIGPLAIGYLLVLVAICVTAIALSSPGISDLAGLYVEVIGAVGLGVPFGILCSLDDWCRVEFRPASTPSEVVVMEVVRRTRIPLTEVTSVVVRDDAVVLYRADETESVCRFGLLSPMARGDRAQFAGWLSELLSPSGVPVRDESTVEERTV